MDEALAWLAADWPAPVTIQAGTTTRQGGLSNGAYASLNLAQHVGDDPAIVLQNRARLSTPTPPCWLEQVHSNQVVELTEPLTTPLVADAAFTRQPGIVCVVMTADCLPLLVTDRAGTTVAAIHAGWRGLLNGIIENTLTAMVLPAQELLIWLGPAIGATAYEVGDEVRDSFIQQHAHSAAAFQPTRPGHWLMNIYQLARLRLQQYGVEAIYGGQECTYTDAQRFYSYRRDGVTGRMASLIWINAK